MDMGRQNFVRNLSTDKNATTYSRVLLEIANKYMEKRSLQEDTGLPAEDIVITSANIINDENAPKPIEKNELNDIGINIALPTEDNIQVIPYAEEVTTTAQS